MIKSFEDVETERIFHLEGSSKFPVDMQQLAVRKLRMINNAKNINDIQFPPANRLELTVRGREDRYSIWINDRWRIYFIWQEGDARKVEIVDARPEGDTVGE